MTNVWWYAARSGGWVAWALLSASVIWGLLLSGKLRPGGVRPNWVLDLHRFLGGLAAIFTLIHVVTIMADSYTDFGPADVLVPFVSTWNPGAVAWGVVGLYLLAAVEITSLLKRHMTAHAWRWVHRASFPLFVTATVHLLVAGTDATNPLAILGVTVVCAAVVGLTVWRITTSRQTPSNGQPARDHAMIHG